MRKFALLFMLCLILLGCKDKKVKDYGEKVVFTEQCDTSAVWRVRTHTFNFVGYIAIALENGKKFSVKYESPEITQDWMLIDRGDTLIYQGNKIVSVIWKEQ